MRRRNGVPLGAPGSLRNMFHRALGATSFAGFWRYWNPIFGYVLARYVHAPLQRFVPTPVSVVITFAVCGALHDLVTAAVRGSAAFLFTPWFVFLGIGVVIGSALSLDLRALPWLGRATVHLAYLGTCLAAAIALRRFVGLP